MGKNTNKPLTSFSDPSLDTSTIAFLNQSTHQLMNVVSDSATQIGKILYDAQKKLASFHNNGAFAKWIEYIGFSRTSAYNYINRYVAVQNLNSSKEIQAFESLPKSLTYDISKPSADPELTKKVLNGDIKTHKEYKALEAKLKQREQELADRDETIANQQAELEDNRAELEDNRAELEDNRKVQLELYKRNSELSKQQPEPKVITKTVTKEVPVKPDDYDEIKAKIAELKEQSAKDKENIEYYKRELKAAERINKNTNSYDKLQEQELKRKKRQAEINGYSTSLKINDWIPELQKLSQEDIDEMGEQAQKNLQKRLELLQHSIDRLSSMLGGRRVIEGDYQ